MKVISQAHRALYNAFNTRSLALLKRHGGKVPLYVTANLVTSCRLGLVLPTTLLLSQGHTWAPASLVMVNAVFDYVDGAVARWEKQDVDRLERRRAAAPPPIDAILPSYKSQALRDNWGAYYDALADKLFAIPVWVAICVLNPAHLWLQLACSAHVAIETVSALVRTQSFYDRPVQSAAVVTAGYKGKIKQAVSMLGTALALVPDTQLVGGVLLVASLPFSLASLKDKLPGSTSSSSKPRVWVVLDQLESRPARVLKAIQPLGQTCDVYVCAPHADAAELWLNMGDFVRGAVIVKQNHPLAFAFGGGDQVWVETAQELHRSLDVLPRSAKLMPLDQ